MKSIPQPSPDPAIGRAATVTLPISFSDEARGAAQWLDESSGALNPSNDYVERNGLPLSELRQF